MNREINNLQNEIRVNVNYLNTLTNQRDINDIRRMTINKFRVIIELINKLDSVVKKNEVYQDFFKIINNLNSSNDLVEQFINIGLDNGLEINLDEPRPRPDPRPDPRQGDTKTFGPANAANLALLKKNKKRAEKHKELEKKIKEIIRKNITEKRERSDMKIKLRNDNNSGYQLKTVDEIFNELLHVLHLLNQNISDSVYLDLIISYYMNYRINKTQEESIDAILQELTQNKKRTDNSDKISSILSAYDYQRFIDTYGSQINKELKRRNVLANSAIFQEIYEVILNMTKYEFLGESGLKNIAKMKNMNDIEYYILDLIRDTIINIITNNDKIKSPQKQQQQQQQQQQQPDLRLAVNDARTNYAQVNLEQINNLRDNIINGILTLQYRDYIDQPALRMGNGINANLYAYAYASAANLNNVLRVGRGNNYNIPNNIILQNVRGNGECFYRAFLNGLGFNNTNQNFGYNPVGIDRLVNNLKQLIISFIISCLQNTVNPPCTIRVMAAIQHLINHVGSLANYINNSLRVGYYGGTDEAEILSVIFNINIVQISIAGASPQLPLFSVNTREGIDQRIETVYLFHTGNHYYSILPRN